MCYFYITGKIEKETIKFYIIYIIYCCYISESPFHCSRKNNIFEMLKCYCLNYRRQFVKTELSLTEFLLRMLWFISGRHLSHTVQGEVCLKEQKIPNTPCPLSAIMVLNEWMKHWADPLNSAVVIVELHMVVWRFPSITLFKQSVTCSWAILMSLAWDLPFNF